MPTPSFHVDNEGVGPTVHPSLTDPKESIYLHWVREENVTGLVYFPFGFYGEISLNPFTYCCSEKDYGIYSFLRKVDDLYPPYFVFFLVFIYGNNVL